MPFIAWDIFALVCSVKRSVSQAPTNRRREDHGLTNVGVMVITKGYLNMVLDMLHVWEWALNLPQNLIALE